MSKRGATTELTDRNWDEDEAQEEAGQFVQADSSTLEKRHIKKAKRKGIVGADSTQDNGGTSTAFKGFTGFSAPTRSAPLFSFGSENKPLQGLSNGSSKKPTSSNLLPPSVGGETSASSSTTKDEVQSTSGVVNKNSRVKYLQHLKKLNTSVSDWIRDHVEKNAYCILTPIFGDYEKHLKEIEDKFPDHGSVDGAVTTPTVDTSSKPYDYTVPVSTATAVTENVFSSGGFSYEKPKLEPPSSTFPKFGSTSTAGFTGFSFGSTTVADSSTSKPFSFAVTKPEGSKEAKDGAEAGDEEYEPPKVEVDEVQEEGSVLTQRCKLFYQKDGKWVEKGVGNLHLKPADGRAQLIIRADTSLGNILLNVLLNSSIPLARQGKNNLSLACVPNPPLDPKVTESKVCSLLIRVNTAEDADAIYEKVNELRESS